MAIEQIPGDCPIKIVQGDDLILQFNIPFSASGYTFTTNIYETNEGNHIIPTAVSVQSSILSIVQTSFYSSITSALDKTINNKYHNWSMKYVDSSSLIRTFISGSLEVI